MATKKSKKDLEPKANPKGGAIRVNDNFTLLRSAKPGKKDLSPKKSPRGGKRVS
jgi:hypothetical protein